MSTEQSKRSLQKEKDRRHGRDNAKSRDTWFFQSRFSKKDKILRGVYFHAAKKRRILEKKLNLIPGQPGAAGSVNWTPVGPSVSYSFGMAVSGRVNSIVVGPGGTRVYAGAANGGVWFSPNGGSTWSPLDDYIVSPSLFGGATEADSLSMGALAVHFGTSAISDEVFAGTGEANGWNYDAYFGIGIRHLTGGTWSLEATNLVSCGISDIVVDPDDVTPTNVYAATTIGLFKRPTSGSFASWTQITSSNFTNSNGWVSSLIVAGAGASKTFYAAFNNDRVYSSPDCVNWTALGGLIGHGRIALAVSESDPSVVYALCADGSIFRLSGTTFYAVTGLPSSVLFADPQGWYDIAIAVDPTDPNTIYVGGDAYAVFKGTITGSAGSFVFPFNSANTSTPWLDSTWVGRGIHSDVHVITFGLNVAGSAHDPTNVWVGSDGGLFQSTASGGAGTFQSRNLGVSTLEFSYLAQRADTDAVVFAGAQDNGTPRLLGEQAGVDRAGGDGGGVIVDPNNPYQIMRQYVYANLYASTDGGISWPGLSFPPITASTTAQQNSQKAENNKTGFVAPLAVTPTGISPTLAAFGTYRLWLTTDCGNTWVTLPTGTNPYTPATPNDAQDSIDGNPITAIVFASTTRIFAATASTIWKYDYAGGTWTSTSISTAGLPSSHYITALAVDDPSAGSFYVTLGWAGVAHLYYYDGTSWHIAMPTSVVDVPTHAVVVDPTSTQNIYVGTDVGCFKGIKSGTTWTWSLFSQGLPEAAITNLAIHNPARLLRAATHGRGVWEIEIDAATGTNPDIYLRVNYSDTGRTPGGARYSWVEGSLDETHVGYLLYHWMSADIKVRRTSLSGLPTLSSPVNYLDFAVNIGDYVDTTTKMETGDSSGIDRIFVEVHNRGLTSIPAAQVNVLLLMTDASAGLPAIPTGYATHINASDTNSSWLSGTPWNFVDQTTPYRVLTNDLDVRTPQVVEYQLDFSSLGLPAGHDHVCLAAFVTSTVDQITSTNTNLDQLTMHDKHVAHRNIHLVLAGTQPGTKEGATLQYRPVIISIDFNNSIDKEQIVDLVFDKKDIPGELAIVLPKLPELANIEKILSGFKVLNKEKVDANLRNALEEWFDHSQDLFTKKKEEKRVHEKYWSNRLEKIQTLDRSKLFIADAKNEKPTLTGIRIPSKGHITASVIIQLPPDTKVGNQYRLNIIQRNGKEIVGGSTYVVVPYKPRK